MVVFLSDSREFNKKFVEQTPDSPGVYGLWNASDPEAIYYGAADSPNTIRSLLEEHLAGKRQPCPPEAKHFKYQAYPPPEPTLLEQLIEQHVSLCRTKPLYNREPGEQASEDDTSND